MKSSQSSSVKIPKLIGVDSKTGNVKMEVVNFHGTKEFFCFRVKQEKNVMMPHEYKMIVIIFLHNMFKGVKVDLSSFYDDENHQFDMENFTLAQTIENNVLITAEQKMFDYIKCPFYNPETDEYFSPFFPELFRVNDFEEKLEAAFIRLKTLNKESLDFCAVSSSKIHRFGLYNIS